MGQLAAKSLINVETHDGRAWYRMLETIHEFARERLAESGEEETLCRRRADYYLALARRAETELRGARQAYWLERLARERDNLRSVLTWALDNEDRDLIAGLAGSIWRFWWLYGQLREGRGWLEAALSDTSGMDKPLLAKLYNAIGNIVHVQTDQELAILYWEKSLALSRELDDGPAIALALHSLGMAAFHRQEHERARALLEESLALSRGLGDDRETAGELLSMRFMAHSERDYQRAIAVTEESLSLFRKLKDESGTAAALAYLGNETLALGQCARARGYYLEALEYFRALGDRRRIARTLDKLAEVAAGEEQWSPSARLVGAAEAIREVVGASLPPIEVAEHQQTIESIRRRGPEAGFAAAWAEGRAMSLDQAIACAQALRP
jgi:tetratricopeptide (TPR) repeat protein